MVVVRTKDRAVTGQQRHLICNSAAPPWYRSFRRFTRIHGVFVLGVDNASFQLSRSDLSAELFNGFVQTGLTESIPNRRGDRHLLFGRGYAEHFVQGRRELDLNADITIVVDEHRPGSASLDVYHPSVPTEDYAMITLQDWKARVCIEPNGIARLVNRTEAWREPRITKRNSTFLARCSRVTHLDLDSIERTGTIFIQRIEFALGRQKQRIYRKDTMAIDVNGGFGG